MAKKVAKKLNKKVTKKAVAKKAPAKSTKKAVASKQSKKVVSSKAAKKESKVDLNKAAEAQNAMLEQDVAPQDLPRGNAIEYAAKAEIVSGLEDPIPAPRFEEDPNEVKLAKRAEKEAKKSK